MSEMEFSDLTLPRRCVKTPRPSSSRWYEDRRRRLYVHSCWFRISLHADKFLGHSSNLYKVWFTRLARRLLNSHFFVDDLFNRLFHHRATGLRSERAHPSYPSETTCSQRTLCIETHTDD